MKVAILGAGNGGCAVAADMSIRGIDVTLIKTSKNKMHEDNFIHLLKNSGSISMSENGETKTANIKKISNDINDIKGCEIVIIYIQTNFHEQLIERISPILEDGQIIVINPGYFSTAYVLKHCANRNITVVEAQSSFIDCRISEPGLIKVGFRNVRNPLGVYPMRNRNYAKEKLDKLGFPFVYLNSVVEAALHNPNMIVHTVGAVMSIPRIEKTHGEYCMYHEVFTPSVWNILEKLDSEKMDVLEAMGYKRLPYVEACKFRNSLDGSKNAKEVFFWYAAMPTRAKGPVEVDSRYISEDVPQGLVMMEALAKRLNVKTPICTSLIELASAALGRDLRMEGRKPERLGIENMDRIIKDSRLSE